MSTEIDENITNVENHDPWDDVPENVYFYESIDDNGRVLSYTNSVEMARSCNYDPSKYISKDDVKISDVDYSLYLKEKCPALSDEVKMQRAKDKKYNELYKEMNNLRNVERATYSDDEWLIRPEDQDNINTFYTTAIAMIQGVIPRKNLTMMSATDTEHPLTPEQIIELMQAMTLKVEEIYARFWFARNYLVANAQTVEEINQISIPSELP